jgi:hypothetical protein
VATTRAPSVASTAAGPSHGSTSEAWYSKNAHVVVQVERGVGPGGGISIASVCEAAAAEHQQLDHRVQLGRVRPALLGDRKQLLEVVAEQCAAHWLRAASQLALPRTVLISPL